MKLNLFMIVSAVLLLGTTSCSKRYNCECSYNINTSAGMLSANHSEEIKAKNQDEAQPECDAIKADLASDTSNTSINCVLE